MLRPPALLPVHRLAHAVTKLQRMLEGRLLLRGHSHPAAALHQLQGLCRLHVEAEVVKLAMRIAHLLLCGFGERCSQSAVRLVAGSLPQARPAQDREPGNSAAEGHAGTLRTELGEASALSAEDKSSLVPGAGREPDASLAGLGHVAAVRLLGEAGAQQPSRLGALVWDALWPCLEATGSSWAGCGQRSGRPVLAVQHLP